jgi:hypothetical protein
VTTGIAVSDCSGVGSCDASGAMLLTMLLLRFDRACWCVWVVVRRNLFSVVSHSSRISRHKSARVRCGNTGSSRETLALGCLYILSDQFHHTFSYPVCAQQPTVTHSFPSIQSIACRCRWRVGEVVDCWQISQQDRSGGSSRVNSISGAVIRLTSGLLLG